MSAIKDDGSMTIRRAGRRWGAAVVLPADYVAAHVELGYAVTAYRAQGITTDTAHALIEPGTTRENLYVAMTRGRHTNTAYVAVDRPDDRHGAAHPGGGSEAIPRSVLVGVLQHVGAEKSARETIAAEQEFWGSIAQLAAEYETIAGAAQQPRWTKLVRASGLARHEVAAAITSTAFGALGAELRRAEVDGFDVDRLLPRLVATRGVSDADDIATVLRERVARATAQPQGAGHVWKPTRLIAGLITPATGPMADDMQAALRGRATLIEQRADALISTAVDERAPWLRELGTPPKHPPLASEWRRAARIVAAYRDRYAITEKTALGSVPAAGSQREDAGRSRAAIVRARQLAAYLASAESQNSGTASPKGLRL